MFPWRSRVSCYPCNRPWRPIGLWEIEAPTFYTQSAHRWWWGYQPHAPAALYPPGRFLILIYVKGSVDPRATVRLEGLGQLINPMTSSGIEPTTFRLEYQFRYALMTITMALEYITAYFPHLQYSLTADSPTTGIFKKLTSPSRVGKGKLYFSIPEYLHQGERSH
jgi:hypothetical protein